MLGSTVAAGSVALILARMRGVVHYSKFPPCLSQYKLDPTGKFWLTCALRSYSQAPFDVPCHWKMAEKSKPRSIHVPSNTDVDPPPQWPRQKPGVACEECRRRKLRCDRRRPQCGNCQSSGVACLVTTRSPRGPKQGYLKSLQARIGELR